MTDDVQTPEQFAAGLRRAWLRCRELGHRWDAFTASWDASAGCYDRSLRCSSCGTVRSQLLDATGHPLRNSYRYPEGYLAGAHVPGLSTSRQVFRLEAVLRDLQRFGTKAGAA